MVRDLAIVGGGISGISCARKALEADLDFVLVEKEPFLGGRMQTSWVEGYGIDRGFQISLTSYPFYQGMDLHELEPCYYRSGALVWTGHEFLRLEDPLRHFPGSLGPLRWRDLTPLVKLFGSVSLGSPRMQLSGNFVNLSSRDYWNQLGLSSDSIEKFFLPFFRGVFLEEKGETSAAFFRFLFNLFAFGRAFIPAKGIGEIPRWLAKDIPSNRLLLGKALSVWERRENTFLLRLSSGEEVLTKAIVFAVSQRAAQEFGLIKEVVRPLRGTTAFYFSASQSPIREPLLALNGSGKGLVNHVAPLSEVSPVLAPEGQALMVANTCVASGEQRAREVQEELKLWFGSEVDGWRLLRAVDIPDALPGLSPGMELTGKIRRVMPGVFACGDYLGVPSQDSAFHSGALAGEAVAEYLRR